MRQVTALLLMHTAALQPLFQLLPWVSTCHQGAERARALGNAVLLGSHPLAPLCAEPALWKEPQMQLHLQQEG